MIRLSKKSWPLLASFAFGACSSASLTDAGKKADSSAVSSAEAQAGSGTASATATATATGTDVADVPGAINGSFLTCLVSGAAATNMLAMGCTINSAAQQRLDASSFPVTWNVVDRAGQPLPATSAAASPSTSNPSAATVVVLSPLVGEATVQADLKDGDLTKHLTASLSQQLTPPPFVECLQSTMPVTICMQNFNVRGTPLPADVPVAAPLSSGAATSATVAAPAPSPPPPASCAATGWAEYFDVSPTAAADETAAKSVAMTVPGDTACRAGCSEAPGSRQIFNCTLGGLSNGDYLCTGTITCAP